MVSLIPSSRTLNDRSDLPVGNILLELASEFVHFKKLDKNNKTIMILIEHFTYFRITNNAFRIDSPNI